MVLLGKRTRKHFIVNTGADPVVERGDQKDEDRKDEVSKRFTEQGQRVYHYHCVEGREARSGSWVIL